MINKDIIRDFDYHESIAIASKTATTTGTGVDCREFLETIVYVMVGTCTTCDATHYFTFKVQESHDNSTWADVATAGYLETLDSWDKVINATTEAGFYVMQIVRSRRWLRVVATESGTATVIFGAWILGKGRVRPEST